MSGGLINAGDGRPLFNEVDVPDETKLEQLREANEELTKENNLLRAQVTQAIELTEKMGELHKDNATLSSKLRDMTVQRDELQQRLELSVKASKSAEDQIGQERQSNARQVEQANMQSKKEMAALKEQHEQEVQSLYAQISALEAARSEADLSGRKQSAKIERLLKVATINFNKEFTSIEELTNKLSVPPQKKETPPATPQTSPQDDQKLKRRCHQLKERLSRMNEELLGSQQQLRTTSRKYESQISDLTAALENQKEKSAVALEEAKHESDVLRAKLEAAMKPKQTPTPVVTESIAFPTQQQIQTPPPPQQPQPQPVQKKQKKVDRMDTSTQEHYVARINALEKQIRQCNERKGELEEIIQRMQSRAEKNEDDFQRMKAELDSTRLIHEETVHELQTMREVISNRKPSTPKQKTSQKVIHQLESVILNLENTIATQRSQICETESENISLKRTNNDLERRIKESTEEQRTQQDKIEQLQNTLDGMRMNETPQITENDILPTYAWRCGEFPLELNSEIEKIVMNNSLQAQTKLQKVFRLVAQFYNTHIQTRDSAIEDFNIEYQQISEIVGQFLIELSIAVSDETVTFNDFMKDKEVLNVVLQEARNLRSHTDDLEAQVKGLGSIAEKFGVSGAVDGHELARLMADAEQKLHQEMDDLNSKNALLKKSRSAARKRVKELTDQTNDLQQRFDELTDEHQTLTEKSSKLSSDYSALKKEHQKATFTMREQMETIEEMKKDFEEQTQEIIKVQTTERFNSEQRLNTEIENLTKELDETKETLEDYSAQVDRLRKAVQIQKNSINEKDEEIEHLKEVSESNEQYLIEKYETEKQTLVSEYEKAVAQISEQCEHHRSDFEQLSVEYAGLKERFEENRQQFNDLKREKDRMERDAKRSAELAQKQKQLEDSNTRASLLSSEAAFQAKLSEQKAQFETEKRRLFAKTADAFRQFFNPSQSINEESFSCIIQQVRNELNRLTQSDEAVRRLVGAVPRQSTEDAVAQLF